MLVSTRSEGTAPGEWEVRALAPGLRYSTTGNIGDNKKRGSWQGRVEEVVAVALLGIVWLVKVLLVVACSRRDCIQDNRSAGSKMHRTPPVQLGGMVAVRSVLGRMEEHSS